MLHQVMANVPLTGIGSEQEHYELADSDSWRNKWLYVRASFDYPITFYQQQSNKNLTVDPFAAATVGIEFHYLNWMSTEINFNISFKDPIINDFLPSIQLQQKFPIKPAGHFMIEPYAALSFPINTSSSVEQFPIVGLGGGCQFGFKGWNLGAFFVDINYTHFLGNVVVKETVFSLPDPIDIDIKYSRFVVGLGIGYKIGFFNRPR